MKIILAAQTLDIDRTSAAISTIRLANSIINGQHVLHCLTFDNIKGSNVHSFLKHSQIFSVHDYSNSHTIGTQIRKLQVRISQFGSLGRFVSNKIHAVSAYLMGFNSNYLHIVEKWRLALEKALSEYEPDLIIARGAGNFLGPHLALVRLKPTIPWIANYHDPFPASLYPAPYYSRMSIISTHQERLNARIIRQAHALTFPSQKLLEWILKDDLEYARSKAFVLPHIGSELSSGAAQAPVDLDGAHFNLVHTGSLLGPRNPSALIEAFSDFIQSDDQKMAKARLIHVGSVHDNHRESVNEAMRNYPNNVVVIDSRVTYAEVNKLCQMATALVLLEHDAAFSPFMPGKLADYLFLRKPILALTPEQSATRDILGHDYPLLVKAMDRPQILSALESMWQKWQNDRLQDLNPPEDAVHCVSEDAVRNTLESILTRLVPRSNK